MSFFIDVSHEEEAHPRILGRETPRTRQVVYLRRAEREIAEKGGYSWVADIRNRVTIAKRISSSPEEYRQALGTMGVLVSDAAKRNGRPDWVYALAEAEAKRIRGENLGLAYGRKAIEGAMRGNGHIDPRNISSIAARAVEVRDYSQLESMASALEISSKYGIRCMSDFSSRISTMERRGSKEAVSELLFAKATAQELRLIPDEIEPKPRNVKKQNGQPKQRPNASARASEQAARQRQIQQEQQRHDRNRRNR